MPINTYILPNIWSSMKLDFPSHTSLPHNLPLLPLPYPLISLGSPICLGSLFYLSIFYHTCLLPPLFHNPLFLLLSLNLLFLQITYLPKFLLFLIFHLILYLHWFHLCLSLHLLLYLICPLLIPYLPIIILSKPGPRVASLSLTPSYVTRQFWITHLLNLHLIKLLLSTLSGVRLLMMSFKPCRDSKHGLWFLHLPM